MFSMLSNVASEAPTFEPVSTSFRSDVISMVPRAIFVGTPRAWKKEVLPGSIPVLPAGTKTSAGAIAPARAGAATFSARITSRVCLRSALVKMKPTLPGKMVSIQTNLTEIRVEDHTFDMRKETLILGEVADETFDGSSNLGSRVNPTSHCNHAFEIIPSCSFPSIRHPRHLLHLASSFGSCASAGN